MSLQLYSTEFMTRRECTLKAAVDPIEGQFVQNEGNDVYIVADGTTFNVYQIWTGKRTSTSNQRTDVEAILTTQNPTVAAAGQITGLFGQYIAEVDDEAYAGTITVADINKGLIIAAGKLAVATGAPGEIIVGYIDETPDKTESGYLRYRRI